MLPRLLLLSLVSVDVSGKEYGSYSDFVRKVLDRKISDIRFYGCQCGFFFHGTQIVDEIDRCCYTRNCCLIRIQKDGCRRLSLRYSYTYENGTITCNNMSSCETCECDKAAVLCIKSHKYLKENRRYLPSRKCGGLPPVC